jgi:hypothetical protein
MAAVRQVVACSDMWVGQDKVALAERLLKQDNWIALDLNKVW